MENFYIFCFFCRKLIKLLILMNNVLKIFFKNILKCCKFLTVWAYVHVHCRKSKVQRYQYFGILSEIKCCFNCWYVDKLSLTQKSELTEVLSVMFYYELCILNTFSLNIGFATFKVDLIFHCIFLWNENWKINEIF